MIIPSASNENIFYIDTSFHVKMRRMLSRAAKEEKLANIAQIYRQHSCPECGHKEDLFSDLQGPMLESFLDCNSCPSEVS
jgi:hypothetical protein